MKHKNPNPEFNRIKFGNVTKTLKVQKINTRHSAWRYSIQVD